MGKMFYKKPLAILAVALAVVLVLLVCLLLINLTQYTGMQSRVSRIEEMVAAAQADEAALEELKAYKNSNEYVIEWAIQHNLLSDGATLFIQGLDSDN